MTDTRRAVLVADDQPDVVAALRLLLRGAGFDAQGASSAGEIKAQLASREYDAVLLDLNYARDTTSGMEGLELIADLHAARPDLPLIAMTGWANVETAVEAMRRGARGYVPKPWANDALVEVVRTEIARTEAVRGAAAGAAREWKDAVAVQRALLPGSLPAVEGYALAARWEPASAFGGDYFDVFAAGPGRMTLVAADVCGKGLPAALLMANLQATVRLSASEGTSARDAVARVNAALCRQGGDRFVTLFVAMLDARARTLEFCNAGHNAPVLVHGNGTVARLDTGGVIAGVFDTAQYETGHVALAARDRLLLFTDGLVEAGLTGPGEYGDARLVDTAVRHRGLDAEDFVAAVFADVHGWAGAALEDDATALALSVEA